MVAAVLGFNGIAAGTTNRAKILSFIFLVLFANSLVAHDFRVRPVTLFEAAFVPEIISVVASCYPVPTLCPAPIARRWKSAAAV